MPEADSAFVEAQKLLRSMLGDDATFRPGQWEAIEALLRRERVLVVQRTGWGKSLVYFIATRMLRNRGAGVTLLISPLISLMRNQIQMAERINVKALTINSQNEDEWREVERSLRAGDCDVLLISPERLGNETFVTTVLTQQLRGSIGMFVIDEAHCVSDWGHDFRPDYQRIVRIVKEIPPSVPVLATTATANNRVLEDIRSQLGSDLVVQRGSLARASLRLFVLRLDDQAQRLAWLAEWIPKMRRTGIVYCLTVADAKRVAHWLKCRGVVAEAYYADLDREVGAGERERLENALLENRIKVLVATVALGMGFDKPDLGFVIHFQRPGSVVAYYQQVGRAGRSLEDAIVILLTGREDDDIQSYFMRTAFPPPELSRDILRALETHAELKVSQLQTHVNASGTMLERALKLLEIDGAVGRDGAAYFRTPNRWQPDQQRAERVTALRVAELKQMQEYVEHRGCLMEFLAGDLDDPHAAPCRRCGNCTGKRFRPQVDADILSEAVRFLRSEVVPIKPRRQWPAGEFPDRPFRIPPEFRAEEGRALSFYGDAGWGTMVSTDKYESGRFRGELISAAVAAVKRWKPNLLSGWVTAVPSRRHPRLVPDFAAQLANQLGLPFEMVFAKVVDTPEQKLMDNSAHQVRNVAGSLRQISTIRSGPVLLVDDIVDSGWTFTELAYLLRTGGSGPVFPFALARSTPRYK